MVFILLKDIEQATTIDGRSVDIIIPEGPYLFIRPDYLVDNANYILINDNGWNRPVIYNDVFKRSMLPHLTKDFYLTHLNPYGFLFIIKQYCEMPVIYDGKYNI